MRRGFVDETKVFERRLSVVNFAPVYEPSINAEARIDCDCRAETSVPLLKTGLDPGILPVPEDVSASSGD